MTVGGLRSPPSADCGRPQSGRPHRHPRHQERALDRPTPPPLHA